MKDKIFEIVNNNVILNENTLLIPELAIIKTTYPDDYLAAYTYIHYMSTPLSPYEDLEEDERKFEIKKDYPGSYNATDKVIVEAIRKCKFLYKSTTENFWEACKKGVEKLTVYMNGVIINDSKEDGNIQHVRGILKECGKTIKEFEVLEKARQDKVNRLRGSNKLGYDQQ